VCPAHDHAWRNEPAAEERLLTLFLVHELHANDAIGDGLMAGRVKACWSPPFLIGFH
jgi:hypothetical protein